MKEDNKNKMKQFVKKYELAFAIAGGAVILATGMIVGYNIVPKFSKDIAKTFKATDLDGLEDIVKSLCKGNGTVIWTPKPGTTVTIAQRFGENAAAIAENFNCGLDATVESIIYTINEK